MKIYENILELVGNTPIVRLNKLVDQDSATVYVKLESFNPMGSVKDRIGLSMIESAERSGKLRPGDTIVEPTSGNTGIALAMVAAVRGYKLVLTMPESMSIERRSILKAFGAEIILVKPEEGPGMTGSIKMAAELAKRNGWQQLMQFDNPANPDIHRKTTAREILSLVPSLDAFVAGIGTGGTITGVGEVLKTESPNTKIIAVEPQASPVISGGKPGPHNIQGIGAGFIPRILNRDIVHDNIQVSEDDALNTTKQLIRQEGLFVGISAGASVFAALKVARKLGKGKTVLSILPDTAERYISTTLFNGED